jgi:hypothetical protein
MSRAAVDSVCVSALLQRLADFRRFGAHALRDLATAVAEGSGGFEGVAGERFRQCAAALRERVFDPRQQAFERRRDFPKLRSGALVDGSETGVEQDGRFLVSPAEPFVDRAAAVDQGLLDCGKLGAETGRESCGSIADLTDHVAAAADEGLLDCRKLGAKIGSESCGSIADLPDHVAAAADKGVLDCRELGAEIGSESCGSIADLPDDVAAAPLDGALEPRETVAKRRLDAPRMGR